MEQLKETDKTKLISDDEARLAKTIKFILKDVVIFTLKWFLVTNITIMILDFILNLIREPNSGIGNLVISAPPLIITIICLLLLLIFCRPLGYIGVCSKHDYDKFSLKKKICLKITHIILAYITTCTVIDYSEALVLYRVFENFK